MSAIADKRQRIAVAQEGSVWRRIVHYKHAYVMILLTFGMLATFNYYPALSGLYRAFFRYDVGLKPEFIGLDHFVRLFTADDIFLSSIGNVAFLATWNVIRALTFPFIVAELIFGLSDSKHKYFYRLAIIVPIVVPSMVNLLLWQFIYDGTHGALNALLAALGKPEWERAWLGDPRVALYAVTFMGFPWVGGINVLIYLAGLQSITSEIIDSAKIDGCTGARRVWYIDMPLIKGQFKFMLVTSIMGGLQGWGAMFVMTRGGPGTATMVPGLWLYNNAFFWGRMGYASAIGMVIFIVIMILTVINMRAIRTSPEA
ncbi:MAG: sugar ABC transporter permease [Anaerolineae bacterium]|nr:sugar ABC transporter permease [Anaerolineae bacterium]